MWLRPTPHPTTATLQILDSDTPGSLFLLFFTGKYQRWTNFLPRESLIYCRCRPEKTAENREMTAGAGEGAPQGRNTWAVKPTPIILATIPDKCNLSINN